MKSTLGRRALICKELGFSLHYVEHGISYAKLQMMMIDMPRVMAKGKDEEKVEQYELTDNNADMFFSMLMNSGKRIKQTKKKET